MHMFMNFCLQTSSQMPDAEASAAVPDGDESEDLQSMSDASLPSPSGDGGGSSLIGGIATSLGLSGKGEKAEREVRRSQLAWIKELVEVRLTCATG